MKRTLVLLLLAGTFASAAGDNMALLGIVAVDVDGKPVIADVLPRSPARKAGLEPGDQLLMLGTKRVATSFDVGPALAAAAVGDKLEIAYMRAGKEQKCSAKLIARRKYKHDYLKRRTSGSTGFKAPPWHAFAWAATGEDKPPTFDNTFGKVVVIHAFQSW